HTMLHDYEQKLEKAYTIDDLTDMDEDAEIDYDQYLEHFASVLGDFPRRIYSSFIVSWYSIIEDMLFQLCEDLGLGISVTVQDTIRLGTGIQRSRLFLAEAANYTIDNDPWQELTKIQKVRNKIVHAGGRFAYSRDVPNGDSGAIPVPVNGETIYYLYAEKSLYRYLDKHELLKFYGTFFINPSFEYCSHLVMFGEHFFTKILHDLKLISP
ncbi:MAG: hypothetical protein KKD28_11675, partial [Chloroflexi bacterium]|nr:hypothetical protein [Chloroflexota bacterium]